MCNSPPIASTKRRKVLTYRLSVSLHFGDGDRVDAERSRDLLLGEIERPPQRFQGHFVDQPLGFAAMRACRSSSICATQSRNCLAIAPGSAKGFGDWATRP